MFKHINILGSTDIGFLGLSLSIKLVSKNSIDLSFTNSNKAYLDYDKTETDNLLANISPNIDLSNYYTETEVDAIDDELSTLILNTYTKPEVGALISNIN